MADTCPAVGVATQDGRATCPRCGFNVESRATYDRVPKHETLGEDFGLDPEKVTATPVPGGGVSIGGPAISIGDSATRADALCQEISTSPSQEHLRALAEQWTRLGVPRVGEQRDPLKLQRGGSTVPMPRAADVYEKCPACNSIDVRRESRPVPRKVCGSCGASVLLLKALPEGRVFKCCQHGVPATESCAACRADGVTDLDRAHMGFVRHPTAALEKTGPLVAHSAGQEMPQQRTCRDERVANGACVLSRGHVGQCQHGATPTPAAMLGEAVWKAMEAAREAERIAHEGGAGGCAASIGDAILTLSGVYASTRAGEALKEVSRGERSNQPQSPGAMLGEALELAKRIRVLVNGALKPEGDPLL